MNRRLARAMGPFSIWACTEHGFIVPLASARTGRGPFGLRSRPRRDRSWPTASRWVEATWHFDDDRGGLTVAAMRGPVEANVDA
ncbi:MAG: hypothetical protein JXR37_18915 [Kiritimatiellae bacterium]|nr:hypothetical protein [Kiritimatiellia bacterium]